MNIEVEFKKKKTQFNTGDSRFALIKWKLNKNKFTVLSMNNVQKVENGEYETGTEYRILYNGIKYKGILVFIGTEQECNETAERLLDRRESNKILQDINKNGINFCKMQIETDFDKMNDKLREKNDRIIELEKSLNELSNRFVRESPRNIKMMQDACVITKWPTSSNNNKTFSDKFTQVGERSSRLQTKLQMLESRIDETVLVIREKDQKIAELEKSVEELTRKARVNFLNQLKKQKDLEVLNKSKLQSSKLCQLYMYGVSPLKDSNIINNESPLKENNQMNFFTQLQMLKYRFPTLGQKCSMESNILEIKEQSTLLDPSKAKLFMPIQSF